MDPTYLAKDSKQFPVCDWIEFYSEVEEPIPPNAPKAIGKVVICACLSIVTMQAINVQVGHKVVFSYTLILP